MLIHWFEQTLGRFSHRAANNRLHHGMLVSGAKGIGKAWFAKDLSQRLLCHKLTVQGESCGGCQACQLYMAGNHPDFYWLTTDKTQIGVDSIRQSIQALNSTAQLSHNKVLVIPDAHLMSEAAANALLKTLEEPTNSTYILLVTHQPNRLLPTIISRCETVILKTPNPQQSLQWLKAQAPESSEQISAKMLAAYGNAPLLALAGLGQKDGLFFADFQAAVAEIKAGHADIYQLANDWHEQAEQIIQWLQRLCQMGSRENVAEQQHEWQLYEAACVAAKKVRHSGTNKTMLLFELLNTIQRHN